MENQNNSNSDQEQNQHRTPNDELYGIHQEPQPEDGAGDFGSAARRPGPEGGVGDLAGEETLSPDENIDHKQSN